MTHPGPITLIVSAVRAEARDVVSIELRDPGGAPLPEFTPGAHLEVLIPSVTGESTHIRHYSLCNNASETHRYTVAVARTAAGRGGSAAIHDIVRVGTVLTANGPRNNFPLETDASHYRFIAGGVGITPILSMLRWCAENDRSWSLLYCARSRNRAAFYEELSGMNDRVQFHFNDECGGRPADLRAALARPQAGEQVYCCGPAPLMQAVEAATVDRSAGSVHFEWFSARPAAEAPPRSGGSFKVVLCRSGKRLVVGPDKSILETLEESGMSLPFSCREGVCRACETPVLSGEVDHRDYVLSDAERRSNQSLMLCVSRAKSPVLELDI